MRTKVLITFLIIGFVFSCRFLDIKENYYKGYKDAIENDFIGNGYMPTDFMKLSISEIRTKLNFDINESLIKVTYKNKADFDSIKNIGLICDNKFASPKTFNLPQWWDYDADYCITLCYHDNYGQSYVFGLDTIKSVIYGWND